MFFLQVCADDILKHPQKVGGQGLTVEIDETLYARRKYNRGRQLPEQWVFGGVCRENNQVFLCAVDRRDKSTLHDCIKNFIEPGSTIMSDMWKGYEGIEKIEGFNFKHYTVNHTENFVDPETGAHTQRIESTWNSLKRTNKLHCGTSREMMDSYLCEFIWRRRHSGKDYFAEILKNIANFQKN